MNRRNFLSLATLVIPRELNVYEFAAELIRRRGLHSWSLGSVHACYVFPKLGGT